MVWSSTSPEYSAAFFWSRMHDNPMAGAQHFFQFGGNEYARLAFFCQVQHQLLDFRFCSHVNALGGFIQDQDLRVRGQPARQDDLLLVPAAQVLDQLIWRWGADPQELDVFSAISYCLLSPQIFEPSIASLQGQDDVFANRQIPNDSFCLAVFGAQGNPMFGGIPVAKSVRSFCLSSRANRYQEYRPRRAGWPFRCGRNLTGRQPPPPRRRSASTSIGSSEPTRPRPFASSSDTSLFLLLYP